MIVKGEREGGGKIEEEKKAGKKILFKCETKENIFRKRLIY